MYLLNKTYLKTYIIYLFNIVYYLILKTNTKLATTIKNGEKKWQEILK